MKHGASESDLVTGKGVCTVNLFFVDRDALHPAGVFA
jgi:hypothetical protein